MPVARTRSAAALSGVVIVPGCGAANSWYVINDMQNASYSFFRSLRPDDYIAVVTYDLRTHILTDFTNDKQVVGGALSSLMIPGFSDTNLFDALYETLDRTSRIEGRKYIILISSGRDTFSKLTLDKMLAKIKATPNVTIFTISTGGLAREMADARGGMGPITSTPSRCMSSLSCWKPSSTSPRVISAPTGVPAGACTTRGRITSAIAQRSNRRCSSWPLK